MREKKFDKDASLVIKGIFLYTYLPSFIYGMPHFLISYAVLISYSLGGSILIEWMKRAMRRVLAKPLQWRM